MSGSERYNVERVGHCEQPVVIIDDFHPHFDALRGAANQSEFARRGPYYPGLQAFADPGHLQAVGALLTEIFQHIFDIKKGVSLVQCSYSIVTTPADDLAPIQRLPHVDTTDPGRIALLHYLSDEKTGGTGFYRHRRTGAELLNDSNFDEYRAELETEGVPKAGYMRGSDNRFELIGHVDAKPNRAIIYRSQLLHSGMIPRDLAFSDDPQTARLTLNSFFQAKP